MLNLRLATLGVAALAIFLTVWAADAAQQTQPPATDVPTATPTRLDPQSRPAEPHHG